MRFNSVHLCSPEAHRGSVHSVADCANRKTLTLPLIQAEPRDSLLLCAFRPLGH